MTSSSNPSSLPSFPRRCCLLNLKDRLETRDRVRNQIDGTATSIDNNDGVANFESMRIKTMESVDCSSLWFGD
ncbi:hypothetical protein HG530_008824 [Fusarium avenaceum]|nr:hypothetical protein HG530_008824 [Fusarium avenaceum]